LLCCPVQYPQVSSSSPQSAHSNIPRTALCPHPLKKLQIPLVGGCAASFDTPADVEPSRPLHNGQSSAFWCCLVRSVTIVPTGALGAHSLQQPQLSCLCRQIVHVLLNSTQLEARSIPLCSIFCPPSRTAALHISSSPFTQSFFNALAGTSRLPMKACGAMWQLEASLSMPSRAARPTPCSTPRQLLSSGTPPRRSVTSFHSSADSYGVWTTSCRWPAKLGSAPTCCIEIRGCASRPR